MWKDEERGRKSTGLGEHSTPGEKEQRSEGREGAPHSSDEGAQTALVGQGRKRRDEVVTCII